MARNNIDRYTQRRTTKKSIEFIHQALQATLRTKQQAEPIVKKLPAPMQLFFLSRKPNIELLASAFRDIGVAYVPVKAGSTKELITVPAEKIQPSAVSAVVATTS